jgi:hypothetical protein
MKRGDGISIRQAAQLLAERDIRPGDFERAASNPAYQRAVKLIKQAIERGNLQTHDNNTVLIEQFIGWARSQTLGGVPMADKFAGFPAYFSICIDMDLVAPDIELLTIEQADCIDTANRKWADCQRENTRLKQELDRLRPLAESWINHCETNRRNACKRRPKT